MGIKQLDMTELFVASYDRDHIRIQKCLARGDNPNTRSLTSLVGYRMEDLMILPNDIRQTIIDAMMMNVVKSSGYYPDCGFDNLYFPSINRGPYTVKLLLEAGANPSGKSLNGLFPLYLAAETGILETVKALVVHGADVNMQTPKGCTALWNAADEGHIEVVRYLLGQGANPHIANNAGRTPLKAALDKRHYNVANLLNGNL